MERRSIPSQVPGTFAVDNNGGNPLSIDYVMVAGGGGGGKRDNAGGGGAGQYVEGSTTCPTSPVTVTIGAGGAHGQPSSKGSDGGYTRLTGALTVSATAGGGGGYAGEPGGSGGGGGYQSEPGGNASPGVGGYPGGSGTSGSGPAYSSRWWWRCRSVLELMAPMLKQEMVDWEDKFQQYSEILIQE